MKKRTKVTCAALAAAVASVSMLAGCQSSGGGTKVDTSKFVTINMYNFGDQTNDNWKTVQDEMNKYIKEKTKLNLGISLHFMTWTNWQSNYATLLASGESIDLINTASDWLNMWDYAQKGAFMDLSKYLPTYAPKLYKKIPQADWNKVKYNGQIIAVPEDNYPQWIQHGLMYRGDWAKQAGLDSINTWDQMGQYFAWIKANKPGVTPFDATASANVEADAWVISTTNTVQLGIGTDVGTWCLESPTSMKVVTPFTDAANMTKYATMVKQWSDTGYWRTDALNNTNNATTELEAGTNGTIEHHVETYAGEVPNMDKKQPGSDLKMFGFWQPSGNLINTSVTHGATSVGSASQNPGRALQLLELIETDKDFYMLLAHGIQNKNYFLNDKGQLYTPTGFDSAKDGFSGDFWGGRQQNFEPDSDASLRWTGYKDYAKSLEKIAKDNPADGFAYDSSNVTSYISAVNNVWSSEGPAIELGKAGDPTTAVNKFIKDLKAAGIDKVTADIQTQLDKWVKNGKQNK